MLPPCRRSPPAYGGGRRGTRSGIRAPGAPRVGSYALSEHGRTVLIDPLAPEGDGGFWEQLDGVVSGAVACLITIGYHLRSAEEAAARYPDATVWGHRSVARRMADRSPYRELSPEQTPAGVRAFAIGNPRRAELPVLVESHAAVAFGDAVVGTGGGLRVWCNEPIDARRRRFYAERFAPTLTPILRERFDHVLPWYHRG